MTPHSSFPGYILLEYLSSKGPHGAKIHTKAWNSGVGTLGGYEAWDTTPIPVETMVDDLVAVLVPHLPTTTTFTQATAYSIAAPEDAPAIPVWQAALADAGTNVGGQTDAAMATFSFKTTGFGDARLVLLDIAAPADFIPRAPANFTTADTDLEAEFCALDKAWSGRDNLRPNQLRRVVFGLSQVLRHKYNYA